MFSEVDITLNIRNNRNYTQTVNVMGNPYNLLDTSNAKTEYRWNVTGFVFTTETDVSIQYKPIDETTIRTYISDLSSQTIDSVVIALNGLGIGYFYTYVELGQTYISTYNDNYFFGGLTIGGTSIIDFSFIYGTGFDAFTTISGIQQDGKIIVVGNFTTYQGNSSIRIIRLNEDGSIDNSFVSGLGFDFAVYDIAIQQDGKILLVGLFTNYNGTPANGIVRLNSDGTIDPTFVYGTGFNGLTNKVAIQNDGKIIIVGLFTSYNGTGANGIIRLNTNGTIDGSFVYGTGFNANAIALKLQTDSKVLVGGLFTTYNGTPANGIIRLNNDGSVDGTFVYGTGINGQVNNIEVQDDGKILLGGQFVDYNGTLANSIIRLENSGTIDATFNYGTGFSGGLGAVISILYNLNKIYVGGDFTNYNGSSANYFTRLNDDGSIDTTYNTGLAFNGFVYGIVGDSNNKVVITGNFTSFDNTTAFDIIRLLPN